MAESPAAGAASDLARTPLTDFHETRGARLVPFAGYAMPLQYTDGIIAEHQHVRAKAGLFDVSHMAQVSLTLPSFEAAAAAVESVTPGNLAGLKPGAMRYTVLLNEAGGIVDDLMVTRPAEPDAGGRLDLVVNADRRDVDLAFLRERLPDAEIVFHADRALLALQGPRAAAVLAGLVPDIAGLRFMSSAGFAIGGAPCAISRSGYTGEDGFEISVTAADAVAVAQALLGEHDVELAGLGARDSLRLEAGLCLYGHDIDETTSPVEAALDFVVSPRRRDEAGFPGAERILRELADGPDRLRVGIRLDGRAPAREGAAIVRDGVAAGMVTSGTFGPTVGAAIAMGYVAPEAAGIGTELTLSVRNRSLTGTVVPLPFVEHRYARKKGGGTP